jgi:FkbM family methyltransferase
MALISYAQNAEDVVLHRAFGGKPTGFYIDVGANDPTVSSVTRCFYDLGWRGINVEPAREPFQRLAAERPRDINLNAGLSDREGILGFFECVRESTWSTFSAPDARWLRDQHDVQFEERVVPVLTLAQVCERHACGEIDFLSIDAENHELEVIRGNDWTRWRPRVLVIEDGHSSQTNERGHRQWQDTVLAAGYLLALVDGINRFYVRKEDEALLTRLSVPANPTDNFVPYRVVALHHELARERELADALRGELKALRGELEATLAHPAALPKFGPVIVALAQRIQNLSLRYPRISAATKRIARLAFQRKAA